MIAVMIVGAVILLAGLLAGAHEAGYQSGRAAGITEAIRRRSEP